MARKKPMKTVPTQFELMRTVRADAEDARFLEWTESGNTGHSKQEGIHPQSQAQGSGRMTLLYTDVKEE